MSVWHKRKAKSHGKDRFLEVPFGGSEARGRVREEDRRRRRPDGAAWGKQAQRLTLLQTGWSGGPGRPTRPCAPRPTPPFSAAVIFSPLGPHSSSSLNYDSQAARPHPSCCHPALPGRLAALISNGHQAAPASLCVRAGDPQLLCSPSSALSLRATQADLLLKTKGSRFRRRPHRTTCPLHLALSLRRPGVLHRAPPACHRRVRVPSVSYRRGLCPCSVRAPAAPPVTLTVLLGRPALPLCPGPPRPRHSWGSGLLHIML